MPEPEEASRVINKKVYSVYTYKITKKIYNSIASCPGEYVTQGKVARYNGEGKHT